VENTIVIFTINETASASLTDVRTGKIWHCLAPQVRCWNVAEERVRELHSQSFLVERTVSSDTFWQFTFLAPKEGISFRIEYSLNGSMLEVSIPVSSIKENCQYFPLLSITPLPGFGAVQTGEPGYMLLPNYSGVICRFDKDISLTHSNMIYMQQSQWEDFADLPVFGVCHKNSAFLGIVTSGEFDTEIMTELNRGPERQNCIYPRLHFRYGKADEIDNVDRRICYHLLSDADADYAGMARTYRNYLLQAKNLQPLRNRIPKQPPLTNYDSYGFIKIFCAGRSPQADGQGTMHITTTFAEVQKILQAIKDAGIEKASVILVGWNQEGHDGKYPTRLPAEPRLGGDEGLKRLVDFTKELGYQITFHDNYADGYQTSPDFAEADVITDRDGWPIRAGIWGGGTSYIMCPSQMLQFAEKDLPRTKSMGLNGKYYLDGTVQPPRICYDKRHGHPATRRAYCEGVKNIARLARKTFSGCEIENAVDFMSDSIDGIAQIITYKLPKVQNTDFGRYFIDDIVPFYQIAYHGILQYRLHCPADHKKIYGSAETGLLKEIEFGAMPRIELCYRHAPEIGHPVYTDYLAFMKKQYDILCSELGQLQLEFIEDHKSLAPNVFKTIYSDGTEVIVNYGKTSFTYGNHIVNPESYLVNKR
jgi:hypothetical protein